MDKLFYNLKKRRDLDYVIEQFHNLADSIMSDSNPYILREISDTDLEKYLDFNREFIFLLQCATVINNFKSFIETNRSRPVVLTRDDCEWFFNKTSRVYHATSYYKNLKNIEERERLSKLIKELRAECLKG